MKYLIILILIPVCLFQSCAKLPVQSIDLLSQIRAEGERMHNLNLTLTNKLFHEKRVKVDNFIRTEYTPKFIDEFAARIPPNTNLKEELPNIMINVIPKINERRDAMQNALEANRIKIIEHLNIDYQLYQSACNDLTNLLKSAVKVDEERKTALNQLSGITGSRIDFDRLETTIDNFIQDSGDWGQNINKLNENINKLLNK